MLFSAMPLLRPYTIQDMKSYLRTTTSRVIFYAGKAGITLNKYRGRYRSLSKSEAKRVILAYRSTQGAFILNRIKHD